MPEATKTIEEVIGSNVRARRELAGWSQAELGERIAAYLGKPWPRQTTFQIERGERAFSASEVAALAHVLGATASRLFFIPPGVESVIVGDRTLPSRELTADQAAIDDNEFLVSLMDTVRDFAGRLRSIARQVGEQAEIADGVDERVMEFLARAGDPPGGSGA